MKLLLTKYFFLLTFSVFVISCGNNKSANEEEESHHELPADAKLALNNGQKWKVNAEMMIPVKHMQESATTFAPSDLNSYIALASILQADINSVVSTCTMTGDAHEMLHVWLLPFIDEVHKLANAKSESEAAATFGHISEALTDFNNWFE